MVKRLFRRKLAFSGKHPAYRLARRQLRRLGFLDRTRSAYCRLPPLRDHDIPAEQQSYIGKDARRSETAIRPSDGAGPVPSSRSRDVTPNRPKRKILILFRNGSAAATEFYQCHASLHRAHSHDALGRAGQPCPCAISRSPMMTVSAPYRFNSSTSASEWARATMRIEGLTLRACSAMLQASKAFGMAMTMLRAPADIGEVESLPHHRIAADVSTPCAFSSPMRFVGILDDEKRCG